MCAHYVGCQSYVEESVAVPGLRIGVRRLQS